MIKVRQDKRIRRDRAPVELSRTDQRKRSQIVTLPVHKISDDFKIVEHHMEIVDRNRRGAAAHEQDAASAIQYAKRCQGRVRACRVANHVECEMRAAAVLVALALAASRVVAAGRKTEMLDE